MSSLEHKIIARIKDQGAITVALFMEIALYDQEHGYYRKNQAVGRDGDFTTAPEISQLFGEMVGIWILQQWQAMESPTKFTLLELGPGKGTLMADILRICSKMPKFSDYANVMMLEVNSTLKEQQQEKLADYNITWLDSLEKLPKKPLIVIGNEFLDCLPIHQFQYDEGWKERMVDIDEAGNLCFIFSDNPTIRSHNLPTNKMLGWYETNPNSKAVVKHLVKYISKYNGYGLFIDYGYDIPKITSPLKDTLQAVQNHKYVDIFHDIGTSDLTAHVNFSELIEESGKSCDSFGTITQSHFLQSLGIELRANLLAKSQDGEAGIKFAKQLQRLIGSDEMGELFKCFSFTKKGNVPPLGF